MYYLNQIHGIQKGHSCLYICYVVTAWLFELSYTGTTFMNDRIQSIALLRYDASIHQATYSAELLGVMSSRGYDLLL